MSHPTRRHGEVLREAVQLAGRRALDVGCGDGALVRLMTHAGAEATGLEISEDKLARARAAEPAGGENYRAGRGEALPFGDGAFDLVVFFNSLHHVPTAAQAEALREAARVLAPGGLLYVLEPLADGPFFEVMRLVDDETAVRAAAYECLRAAADDGLFDHLREYRYDAPSRYASFAAFEEQILAVDPGRGPAFARHRETLRARFESAAARSEEGYGFSHLYRLNLLARPAVDAAR